MGFAIPAFSPIFLTSTFCIVLLLTRVYPPASKIRQQPQAVNPHPDYVVRRNHRIHEVIEDISTQRLSPFSFSHSSAIFALECPPSKAASSKSGPPGDSRVAAKCYSRNNSTTSCKCLVGKCRVYMGLLLSLLKSWPRAPPYSLPHSLLRTWGCNTLQDLGKQPMSSSQMVRMTFAWKSSRRYRIFFTLLNILNISQHFMINLALNGNRFKRK